MKNPLVASKHTKKLFQKEKITTHKCAKSFYLLQLPTGFYKLVVYHLSRNVFYIFFSNSGLRDFTRLFLQFFFTIKIKTPCVCLKTRKKLPFSRVTFIFKSKHEKNKQYHARFKCNCCILSLCKLNRLNQPLTTFDCIFLSSSLGKWDKPPIFVWLRTS